MVVGRGGMFQGWERMVWYSSTLMSEVRVRALRPRASGGKVGMVKVWRGILGRDQQDVEETFVRHGSVPERPGLGMGRRADQGAGWDLWSPLWCWCGLKVVGESGRIAEAVGHARKKMEGT